MTSFPSRTATDSISTPSGTNVSTKDTATNPITTSTEASGSRILSALTRREWAWARRYSAWDRPHRCLFAAFLKLTMLPWSPVFFKPALRRSAWSNLPCATALLRPLWHDNMVALRSSCARLPCLGHIGKDIQCRRCASTPQTGDLTLTDPNVLADRRRLRRKLGFWRIFAVVAAIAVVAALALNLDGRIQATISPGSISAGLSPMMSGPA
jgi:hypothetical protein